MKPLKIISGGQIGADIGGLKAAKQLGIATGGTMPKGFLAKDRCHPEYAELYGVVEHTSKEYPPRTAANVRDSDGTVRFALNFNSLGEKLTLRLVLEQGKPYFDVDLKSPPPVNEFRDWLISNRIQTLNVAGNADTANRGDDGPICRAVVKYLVEVFSNG